MLVGIIVQWGEQVLNLKGLGSNPLSLSVYLAAEIVQTQQEPLY